MIEIVYSYKVSRGTNINHHLLFVIRNYFITFAGNLHDYCQFRNGKETYQRCPTYGSSAVCDALHQHRHGACSPWTYSFLHTYRPQSVGLCQGKP